MVREEILEDKRLKAWANRLNVPLKSLKITWTIPPMSTSIFFKIASAAMMAQERAEICLADIQGVTGLERDKIIDYARKYPGTIKDFRDAVTMGDGLWKELCDMAKADGQSLVSSTLLSQEEAERTAFDG